MKAFVVQVDDFYFQESMLVSMRISSLPEAEARPVP